MFLRALITAASLAVAMTGVAAIDCASTAVELFTGDPRGVCSALGSPGDSIALWLGIALVTFAIICLLATWLVGPLARRKPDVMLKEHLARIPNVGMEPPEPAPAAILHVTRITRRVESLERAVTSESAPVREVTRQWMSLLWDINDLHNRDELPTKEFKEFNTRLLALFAGPGDEDGEAAATR